VGGGGKKKKKTSWSLLADMATSKVILILGAGATGSVMLRNTKASEILNDLTKVEFLKRFRVLSLEVFGGGGGGCVLCFDDAFMCFEGVMIEFRVKNCECSCDPGFTLGRSWWQA
jgi:hypothetical protein